MFYDKKIKYVDVYENGEKVQNAGFVRMEARDEKVRLQFQITGLKPTDTIRCPIILLGAGKEALLGEIYLEKGRGTADFVDLQVPNLRGEIGYEDLEEIQIKMAGNRLLRCMVKEASISAVSEVAESVPEASIPAVSEVVESVPEASVPAVSEVVESVPEASIPVISETVESTQGENPLPVHREDMVNDGGERRSSFREAVDNKVEEREEKTEAELLKEAFLAEKKSRECVVEEEKEQHDKKLSSKPQEREMSTPPQMADKWHQLQAIYPHIRPFEDMREYLLIKPQDFVVLTKKDFALSSNSFLLHGYYNYEHLILARVEGQEGELFYIGVPGNFYDKEKQVAIMFGFESFEGKREPARTGDFGYYMISVEL